MKLKDWVTLCNLLCGVGSVVSLIEGRFDLGCYLVILGFLFDAADGLVARLTKQFNKFGGELDNLCDLVTYGLAPGFLVYHAFHAIAGYPIPAALAMAFLPVAAGTVRAARYNVRRAEFPGFFIGMPRTAFALFIVALFQSSLFRYLAPLLEGYLYAVPAALIVWASFMLLSLRPYVGHHNRKWKGWIRFGMWWFLLSIPVGFFGGWLVFNDPAIVFDVLLFDLLVYFLLSNLILPKELKAEVTAYIKEWKAMGEEAK